MNSIKLINYFGENKQIYFKLVFIWCWIDTNCSSLLTLNTTLLSQTKQLHLVATYENTVM